MRQNNSKFKNMNIFTFVEKYELELSVSNKTDSTRITFSRLQNDDILIRLDERQIDFKKLKKILLENGYIIHNTKNIITFKKKNI
jgi:hypothetical protein